MWTMNFQFFKLDLEKTKEPEIELPTSIGSLKKAREFQRNIYFCFIGYTKAFDCLDHNKLWKILKEVGISDHLTCLLRNLYAGQEAAVRTGQGTTVWFQIGKGVPSRLYMYEIATLYNSSIFNCLRKFHTVLRAVPVYNATNSVWWFPFLTSPPALVFHCFFEGPFYQIGVFFADLICISLRIGDVEIFSCAFRPFVLKKNVYSDPLPILKLGCWFWCQHVWVNCIFWLLMPYKILKNIFLISCHTAEFIQYFYCWKKYAFGFFSVFEYSV